MAALSRPSLRSSVRKHPDLGLPATDHDPSVKRLTRRQGKRTRDSSLDSESNASSKRLKNSPQEPSRVPTRAPRNLVAKALPFRDKQFVSSQDAVTQPGRRSRRIPAPTEQVLHHAQTRVQSGHPPPNVPNHTTAGLVPARPAQNTAPQVDKRSLRSHDGGSRSKSELSQYFHNYDELTSIEQKPQNILTPETILFVIDEPAKPIAAASHKTPLPNEGPAADPRVTLPNAWEVIDYPADAFTTLTDAVRIDLSKLAPRAPGRASKDDPLGDEVFIKVHRRLERQEKQLRNIEKERAMHEKVQLERLLDGLKGPDWLRVMGISGITDGDKKAYEPKRDHLIREVKILLEKFRLWKEEEKRRKVEKEEEEEDDDEDSEEEDESAEEEGMNSDEGEDDKEENGRGRGDGNSANNARFLRPNSPSNDSDIDASAARQLHLEATRASQLSQISSQPLSPLSKALQSKPPRRRPRPPSPGSNSSRFYLDESSPNPIIGTSHLRANSQLLPSSLAPPKLKMKQAQITSFFSKPYLRDAAIGQHRRSGRSRFAFGRPVPEIEERSFELPEDILTEDAIRRAERRGRAGKRGRKE